MNLSVDNAILDRDSTTNTHIYGTE
jgi:hypothetical protein